MAYRWQRCRTRLAHAAGGRICWVNQLASGISRAVAHTSRSLFDHRSLAAAFIRRRRSSCRARRRQCFVSASLRDECRKCHETSGDPSPHDDPRNKPHGDVQTTQTFALRALSIAVAQRASRFPQVSHPPIARTRRRDPELLHGLHACVHVHFSFTEHSQTDMYKRVQLSLKLDSDALALRAARVVFVQPCMMGVPARSAG